MTEPSELRRFAMQCMERAQALTDPKGRAAWLEMAANGLGSRVLTNELRASNSNSKSSRNKSPRPRIEFAEGRPPNPISSL